MKVLIVEDDRNMAELVKDGLMTAHTVEVATDGAEGSFLARSYDYDAIVLDYSLPKKNGLVVCAEIRAANKTTPIIFLSATDEVEMKVSAFDKGADDYMTKPFSIDELQARLRAIARRPVGLVSSKIQIDDLVLDCDNHDVMRGDQSINLTRKEFGLLEYLMKNPGKVISRAQIMEHVWTADNDPFSNTVEAHISNVRKKLNAEGKPNIVLNVPGRGYMIENKHGK